MFGELDWRQALKVKIKSLTEEARIIRREERLAKTKLIREGLRLHRIEDVRQEARNTHIAYGFMRGRSYGQIEHPRYGNNPDWDRVWSMVKKYARPATYELYGAELAVHMDQIKREFDKWRKEAVKISKITV
jgi:hypothetical protein